MRKWTRMILSRRKVILQFDSELQAEHFYDEVMDMAVNITIAKVEEEL